MWEFTVRHVCVCVCVSHGEEFPLVVHASLPHDPTRSLLLHLGAVSVGGTLGLRHGLREGRGGEGRGREGREGEGEGR